MFFKNGSRNMVLEAGKGLRRCIGAVKSQIVFLMPLILRGRSRIGRLRVMESRILPIIKSMARVHHFNDQVDQQLAYSNVTAQSRENNQSCRQPRQMPGVQSSDTCELYTSGRTSLTMRIPLRYPHKQDKAASRSERYPPQCCRPRGSSRENRSRPSQLPPRSVGRHMDA